jgi:2-polyprenyl-6-methoxyphenol hydroxylase-like FAD-dependent oxidoreductase
VTYRAPLIVGDDGTHSRIRSAMGASIALQDFPFDFMGAIMSRPTDQPPQTGQVWLNLKGIRQGLFAGLFLPIPRERTAVVFILTPGAAQRMRAAAPETFYDEAARLSPLCETRGRLPVFPDGFGYFRRPFGLASRYVGDGAALLGDAAHPVTPAGGQGANSSVADADVLAQVALEALRSGDCSAVRLACYEAIRRPANPRSLQFSQRPRLTFRLLQVAPWLSPLLREFLRAVDQREPLKVRFITSVSRSFTSPMGSEDRIPHGSSP